MICVSGELNLEKFDHAIEALIRSLRVLCETSDSNNSALIETVKSGVIQNFEVAYDQCWKIMTRWLDVNVGRESLHSLSRKDLFREAAKYELIDDIEQWFKYHLARNNTSHNYDQSAADDTILLASEFVHSTKFLRQKISS